MPDNELLNEMLKNIPNARKVADGWLIEGDDGHKFHAFDVHSLEELEDLTTDEHFYLPFCSRDEIFRMRKISNAHDYLLWLRAEAIADSPRFIRVFRSRVKGVKNWSLTTWYLKRENVRKNYISRLTKGAEQKVKLIPAGMALLKEVNAMCIHTTHGNVIAVSETLGHFLYYMNLAFYGSSLGIDDNDCHHALFIAVRIMLGTEAIDFDLDPRGPPLRIFMFLFAILPMTRCHSLSVTNIPTIYWGIYQTLILNV